MPDTKLCLCWKIKILYLLYFTASSIIAIPKSVTKTRIEKNLEVFDFELSDAEMKMISGFKVNYRICNPLVFMSKYYPFIDNYSE